MSTGHNMGDWLALHDLTPEICIRLLNNVPPRPETAVAKPGKTTITLSPEDAWNLCASAVLEAMPEAKATLTRVTAETIVNFFPDPKRFPRAFTLHDAGQGRPYVSCPWRYQMGDLLSLAHEFGHALQITASEGRDMPPVARETCAIISEIWLTRYLLAHKHPIADSLFSLVQFQSARVQNREGSALLRALPNTAQPYDYNWNYPLADRMARLSMESSVGLPLWSFFKAEIPLATLINLLHI